MKVRYISKVHHLADMITRPYETKRLKRFEAQMVFASSRPRISGLEATTSTPLFAYGTDYEHDNGEYCEGTGNCTKSKEDATRIVLMNDITKKF